jgi:haloalkane dehalogenase
VGQDWGGPIGMLGVAGAKAPLKATVILNTVLGPPREGFKPTAFHRFARMPIVSDLAFRVAGFMPRGMAGAQGDKKSISGDTARAYRWVLRDPKTRVAPLALARMVPDSMQHRSIAPLRKCEEITRAFKGPAELVWGDKDPVLGGVRKHMMTLLPNARVSRTEGGHFLQEEVPDVIAGAIRRVAG